MGGNALVEVAKISPEMVHLPPIVAIKMAMLLSVLDHFIGNLLQVVSHKESASFDWKKMMRINELSLFIHQKRDYEFG